MRVSQTVCCRGRLRGEQTVAVEPVNKEIHAYKTVFIH